MMSWTKGKCNCWNKGDIIGAISNVILGKHHDCHHVRFEETI